MRAPRMRSARQVSGSDGASSPYAGAPARPTACSRAQIGHDAANVPAGEDVELVYSSAVPAENPERAAARERGLRGAPARGAARRAERAAAHDRGRRHARQDDDVVDGRARAARGRAGSGLADRRRRSAAGCQTRTGARASGSSSRPTSPTARCSASSVEIAVLTNVELDHHATFASLASCARRSRAFLARATRAVVVWDRPELLALMPGGRGRGRRRSTCRRRRC